MPVAELARSKEEARVKVEENELQELLVDKVVVLLVPMKR